MCRRWKEVKELAEMGTRRFVTWEKGESTGLRVDVDINDEMHNEGTNCVLEA